MLPTKVIFPSLLQHEDQGPAATGSLPWVMSCHISAPCTPAVTGFPKNPLLRSRRETGLLHCLGQFLGFFYNNFSFFFQEDFFPPLPFLVNPPDTMS